MEMDLVYLLIKTGQDKTQATAFLALSILSWTDSLLRLTCFKKTWITFFTTTLSATTTIKTASNCFTFIVTEYAKYQLFYYTLCIAKKKSISTQRPLSWSGCNVDERENINIDMQEWKLTILVTGNNFCLSMAGQMEPWPGICVLFYQVLILWAESKLVCVFVTIFEKNEYNSLRFHDPSSII